MADAILIAFAYYLSFRLRFLESPGGVPDRYGELFWGSIPAGLGRAPAAVSPSSPS